ncbi:hypothetical protein B0H17DRAFT_252900 [Mycena rosella]|uniref:F-box domain-containing protein n=1 Tax=Mycena rosella TaxID=1033263 RepID=A0AAD7GP61_MYCRO|nr:hypothetical protein B0H17DRAFT_252900 [Mycena rosella]
MASLEVLLDNTVSAFSGREARLALTVRIDIALKDIERAQTTIKAANRSPVKQAFKLFRSRSTTKLNAQWELRKDENAAVVALAHEVSSGRRSLPSLQRFKLSLLQRALRTRRNSLASIFRLPTEVLAPILEQCPTIEDDAPYFQTSNFVSGLKLAHVCHRWREIAMKSSRFWTHIVLSRPRWALEMLHRSRGAPLVVGVDMAASATKTVAARDLMLAQLGRIHELHVDIPASRSLPSSLLAPAPILDTFCLRYDMAVGEPVVPGLFQGQAPALRHLSLRCCTLDWASPLWDNLVSLELLDAGVDNDETGQFLPLVLARMRHLRTLKLTGAVPEPMDDLGVRRLSEGGVAPEVRHRRPSAVDRHGCAVRVGCARGPAHGGGRADYLRVGARRPSPRARRHVVVPRGPVQPLGRVPLLRRRFHRPYSAA